MPGVDVPPRLYEPLHTLKRVHDNVWIADGPPAHMAMYGAKIPFPTRMTVVRLGDGDLWCHSPTELHPKLARQIDRLGPVRHLVSPNRIHYAHIRAWKEAYPEAIAWASPGVRERAASQRIEVRFDRDLGDAPPPEWAAELDQTLFRGSRFMDEAVFFHRASATLILTDMIENFEPSMLPAPMRLMAKLAGCLDPDGKAPLDLRLTFLGGKKRARASLERLLRWQPETVLLAHGRWYPRNGAEELRRAFRWLD